MKQARELFSSVHLNGKIYVIGGLLPVSTPNCEVYSPNTDEWHSIASLPCLDTGVYAIVAKNKIVIPMSSDESHEFSHEALKYNVQSNAWQKVDHFGPNNELTSFTLCIIRLPAMFLQCFLKTLVKAIWNWKRILEEVIMMQFTFLWMACCAWLSCLS